MRKRIRSFLRDFFSALLTDSRERYILLIPLFYCLWDEIIFSLFLSQGFTVHKFLFSLTWGLLLYGLGQLPKKKKTGWILQTIPAVICTIIYCAQVSYYTLFQTPFYLKSLKGAGDTMTDFFGVAVDAVINVGPAFALMLAGFILWCSYYHKIFMQQTESRRRRRASLIVMIISVLITPAVGLLDVSGAVSPSHMLRYEFVPTESVRTFGMLATELLDIKYNILHIAAAAPELTHINLEEIEVAESSAADGQNGETDAQFETASANSDETGAQSEAAGANSNETGTQSEAAGANSDETGTQSEAAGANSDETGTQSEAAETLAPEVDSEDEDAEDEDSPVKNPIASFFGLSASGIDGKTPPDMEGSWLSVYNYLSGEDDLLTESPGYNKTDIDSSSYDPAVYNVLPELDFTKEMNKSEEDQDPVYADMNSYFSHRKPSKKNDYTGMFKSKNLILITAEAFSRYVIDPELTPTLYRMQTEGFTFNHFHTGVWGVSTSDGEFVATTGLIPKAGVWSYTEIDDNYMPFAFGNQFKALDYLTYAFHDHSYTYYNRNLAYPNMGYTYYANGYGLLMADTWPESDTQMIEQSTPVYSKRKAPFHVYYMTVSGHLEYTWDTNDMSVKHKAAVSKSKYKNCSEEVQAYVASQLELEEALSKLISDLDRAGVLDDTVIALSPDHYPYGLTTEQYSELRGEEIRDIFDLYKSTFLIWNSQMKDPVTSDAYCSSLDIAPTLSNLFGLGYDSRLYMGTDIFGDISPVAIFQDRSFITDRIKYDSTNQVMTVLDGKPVSAEYLTECSEDVKNRFYYSAKIIETDYYGYLFDKEES